MKCTECGQTIGDDLHPRVRQAAQVATHAALQRIYGSTFEASKSPWTPEVTKQIEADVEEIIVTTLELAGLTEPKVG